MSGLVAPPFWVIFASQLSTKISGPQDYKFSQVRSYNAKLLCSLNRPKWLLFPISFSGRAPLGLSLDVLKSQGFSTSNPLPPRHAHNVTVPGAAAGWVDTVDIFGSGKVGHFFIVVLHMKSQYICTFPFHTPANAYLHAYVPVWTVKPPEN